MLPEASPQRRHEVVVLALRTSAITVVLLLAYAIAPVNTGNTVQTVVRLMGCLVVFFAVIAWQVRSIIRSDRPIERAVETLVTVLVLLLVIFAYTYVVLSHDNVESFSESIDRIDGIYFTSTVLATVGFGDIAPVSTSARIVVTVQMVTNLIVVGAVLRVIVRAAQEGRARTSRTPTT
jgi:voltage-gated potassium channel